MADPVTLPSPDDPEAALASVVALRDLAGVTRGGLVLTKDTSMFLRCDELQPQ